LRNQVRNAADQRAALALDHENQTSRPLALIAMALLVAFAKSDDGKELRQVVRELS
jgi:hypothetical protein